MSQDRAVLDMSCWIAEDTKPECGCPHEHWHIYGYCLDIHFEEDGSAHLIMFVEEDERERFLETSESMDGARRRAFDWMQEYTGLPVSEPQHV